MAPYPAVQFPLTVLGVFAGAVVGLLAGGAVSVYADRLSEIAAATLVGYAAFGVAFVAILARVTSTSSATTTCSVSPSTSA